MKTPACRPNPPPVQGRLPFSLRGEVSMSGLIQSSLSWPAGHCLLPAMCRWGWKALPLLPAPHPAHCPLTCTSGQAHQGQDGPEAAPGPRLGIAQPKHLCAPPPSLLEGQRSPDHSAHISPPYIGSSKGRAPPFPAGFPPPTKPLPWIGGSWPQLLPGQPLKPESGSPRGYCAARGPPRGTDPAPSPTSPTTQQS